jgi:hypothetical protein
MTTLTVDEALARLRTWTSEPGEETRDALVAAALAFTVSDNLRESSEIVDLDDDDHGFSTLDAVMMRSSGCHFAAKVPRLGDKWVGFGSSGRKAVQP